MSNEALVVDFDDYEEEKSVNTDDVLGRITVLAKQLVAKELEIATAEDALKRLKAQRAQIEEVDLPELFHSVGQTKLQTHDGIPLVLKNVLRVNISKDRKHKAIKWLDDNGHGGIVKRKVIVDFDKTKEDKVENLLRLIDKGWPNNRIERDVNTATAKALINRLLQEGKEVDKTTFGVHQVDKVSIGKK